MSSPNASFRTAGCQGRVEGTAGRMAECQAAVRDPNRLSIRGHERNMEDSLQSDFLHCILGMAMLGSDVRVGVRLIPARTGQRQGFPDRASTPFRVADRAVRARDDASRPAGPSDPGVILGRRGFRTPFHRLSPVRQARQNHRFGSGATTGSPDASCPGHTGDPRFLGSRGSCNRNQGIGVSGPHRHGPQIAREPDGPIPWGAAA